MLKSGRTVRKYVISSAVVTTLAFTPLLSGGAFAYVNSGSVHQNSSANHQNSSTSNQNSSSNNQNSSADTENISKTQDSDSSSKNSTIRQGDHGQAVKDLQSELKDQGYYTYHLDGIAGPITEDAVSDFQVDHKLSVDGIAGPKTFSALSSTSEDQANNPQPQNVSTNQTTSQSGVASIAKSLIGTPYVWGGTNPDQGFDSSGFINYVFSQVGVDLSRTENAMWQNDGVEVDSPSVGDVVFFQGTYDTDGASHSGIYIGNNQIVHAGSDGVTKANLGIDYWQNHYLGVKSFK